MTSCASNVARHRLTRYEECGVCFDAPTGTLALVRGLHVDSCAFSFRGKHISVGGEHSGWVAPPNLPASASVEAFQDSGLRIKYRSPDRFFEGVWLPRTSVYLPLELWVTYDSDELKEVADLIASTTTRCGPQIGDPTQGKPRE